jgi:hypothetical protein
MHSHDRDLEKLRGLCGEIYTASSHDVTHAVSIKTEEFSDAEVVEAPVAITFPGIKDEPEVSCVSVKQVSQIHNSSIYKLLLKL